MTDSLPPKICLALQSKIHPQIVHTAFSWERWAMEPIQYPPNNNPLSLRIGLLTANMNLFRTFSAYLGSYEHAVEVLYNRIARGEEPVDMLAVPLLFLMRHCLELGHKFTLRELHAINKTPYDFKKYKGHDLAKLHAAMKEEYKKAAEVLDLPSDEIAEFDRHCQRTSECVNQFAALDPGGTHCRYPFDNDGKLVFGFDTFNLLSIKNDFDAGMLLLRHTADVLEPYRKYMAFLDSEVPADYGPLDF